MLLLALHLPLSLGGVQAGKGDLPDASIPGSPYEAIVRRTTDFCSPRPGRGHWEPMAADDRTAVAWPVWSIWGASVSISARPVRGPR
ncbi:hypothetical protein ACJEDM_27710 [Klebsiella pneumoniae]